jgi:hypothetical protein
MKRVFDGLSMIALGVVLLACTTGFLPWAIWISIFSLWPLLLVSIGIDIIGSATHNEALRVLGSVVFIGGLLYGAFVMPAGTWGLPFASGSAEAFSVSKSHDPAVLQGSARVQAGAEQLSVKAGSDLAAISGRAPVGAAPGLSTVVAGSTGVVEVTHPNRTIAWLGGPMREQLDLTLDKAVKWTALDVSAGATRADIDLTDLEVEDLSVQTGASDVVVTLGEKASEAKARISAGAASIKVRVPKSAKVTLHLSGALTSSSVPSDFTRVSGVGFIGDTEWTGDGTGAALDITLSAGAASLVVERY